MMTGARRIRYARSGDVRIAYETFGDGDLDLLVVPGFISNLDLLRELPPFRHPLERFGTFARCIAFDKRGTGLSDRTLGFGSLEERADDLRAVLDDAGVERAAVFGYSEGGPLGLVFAAAYPERVSALALYGTAARFEFAPDYPDGIPRHVIDAGLAQVERVWGQGFVLRVFIGHAPENDATTELIARYERGAASPAMAAAVLRRNTEIDIRPLLGGVMQPTLVLHAEADPVVPSALGRYLAAHLPNSQYVERPGAFHMVWNPEEMWWLDEVETFLTGHRPVATSVPRFLATVLITDIVGSTTEATQRGDRAWRELLDEHDRLVAEEVHRHGGRVVKSTGDGVLALIDSPSRAIACARLLHSVTATLGVTLRAGIHTGEVEGRGDDIGGVGVHIAARIADLAGPGEVWVSRTVRDLTVGSQFVFRPQGVHELRGVPEGWELYTVDR